MMRYDSFHSITTPVDHDKVYNAISQVIKFAQDVVGSILSEMNVTVDNGNVFFYSRKTATDRYFVEVKAGSKTVKIILASAEDDLRMTKVQPCQDQPENGHSENVT